MKKTWIVLAMAAALCAACDESKEESKCVENQATCDNGQRMVCTNGKFVAIACPSNRVCQNGACMTPAAAECQMGLLTQPQCSGNNAIQYCNNGVIKIEACPTGYKCAANPRGEAYCAKDTSIQEGACTLNETRCSLSGVLQTCALDETQLAVWKDTPCESGTCQEGKCIECKSGEVTCESVDNSPFVLAKRCSEGQWEILDTCNKDANSVCRSGKCYDKNACKTNEAIQCGDGEVIQTCQNNVWVTTDVCKTGEVCHEGKCYDSSIPWKGDPCDEATFDEICSDNGVVYCDEGKVNVMKCIGGAVCASAPYSYVDEESGKTEMAKGINCYSEEDICDPASTAKLTSCANYTGYGYLQSDDDCLLADNGKYYQVPMTYYRCPAGCDGNVCAEGTSGGNDDDVIYDCSSEKVEGGRTVKDMCMDYNGTSIGLCIPCSNKVLNCTNDSSLLGQHAGAQYCDGGSSEHDDYEYYYCGDMSNGGVTLEEMCKEDSATSLAICYNVKGKTYYECDEPCTTIGQTQSACADFGTYGDNQYKIGCQQIDSIKVWVDVSEETDYVECKNGCNTAGTACK